MRSLAPWLLLVLSAACSKVPGSATQTVQCVPRGLGAEGLDAQWQPFAAQIQACVVIDPAGTPALELIAVSAESPEGAVTLPLPLILLPGGKAVGRLPRNHPDIATTLQFGDWHEGIPRRIEQRVSDRAVRHREVEQLSWDAGSGRYERTQGVRSR